MPSVGVVPARWPSTTPSTSRRPVPAPPSGTSRAHIRLPPAGVLEPVFSPTTPGRSSSVLVLRNGAARPGSTVLRRATVARSAGSFIASRASTSWSAAVDTVVGSIPLAPV